MMSIAMNYPKETCDRKKLTHVICTLQAVRSSEIIKWLKIK